MTLQLLHSDFLIYEENLIFFSISVEQLMTSRGLTTHLSSFSDTAVSRLSLVGAADRLGQAEDGGILHNMVGCRFPIL